MDELMAVYLSEITKIETHVYHDTPDASVKRIKYFLETQTNHNVCYYLNDGITKFLGVGQWQGCRLEQVLVAGPFLSNADFEINSSYRWNHELSYSLQSLTILNDAEIKSIGAVMLELVGGTGTLVELTSSFNDGVGINNDSFTSGEDENVINQRYQRQREFIAAITNGDRKMADRLTNVKPNSFFTPFMNRVPSSPLRSAKNIGFVYNTMCRIGAESGGVRPLDLHRISEKYAILIEQARSLNSTWQLVRTMAQEYCDLVMEYGDRHYGRLVNETLNYVRVRSAEPLTLAQIAQTVHASPSVVSRNFKQATGQGLFDFIKQQRIEHAKTLLRQGNLTIGTIAVTVGFNDQNYFSRVFKQLVGQTPSQYAKEK